jgi:hypothetical protein
MGCLPSSSLRGSKFIVSRCRQKHKRKLYKTKNDPPVSVIPPTELWAKRDLIRRRSSIPSRSLPSRPISGQTPPAIRPYKGLISWEESRIEGKGWREKAERRKEETVDLGLRKQAHAFRMLGRGDLVREVGCEGGGPVIGRGKGRTDTGGGTRGKKGRKEGHRNEGYEERETGMEWDKKGRKGEDGRGKEVEQCSGLVYQGDG